MKTLLLFFATLFLAHVSIAQIAFEKGYFIGKDGTRTECMIKNLEWKNNPSEFLYKTENSPPATVPVSDVIEFGVYNQSVYKVATVNIDRSVFTIGESFDRNPDFKKETLALKVLVTGTASLYYFEDHASIRFFFQVGAGTIEQLVYKEYMAGQQRVAKNELFKNQLWLNAKCGEVTQETVSKLRYDKRELINYFQKFNLCSGDQPIAAKAKQEQKFFIHASPGIGVSSVVVEFRDSFQGFTSRIDNNVSYRLGAELEFILPFNRNKWGFLLEPSFNTFSGKDDEAGIEVKYNTLELGLGARHFFYAGRNGKIFLNVLFIGYFPLDKSIGNLNLETTINYGAAVGGGYGFKRFSVEARHYFGHEVIGNYVSWSTRQQKTLLVLGYRIF